MEWLKKLFGNKQEENTEQQVVEPVEEVKETVLEEAPETNEDSSTEEKPVFDSDKTYHETDNQ